MTGENGIPETPDWTPEPRANPLAAEFVAYNLDALTWARETFAAASEAWETAGTYEVPSVPPNVTLSDN